MADSPTDNVVRFVPCPKGFRFFTKVPGGPIIYVKKDEEPKISVLHATICTMLGPEGAAILEQAGAIVRPDPDTLLGGIFSLDAKR